MASTAIVKMWATIKSNAGRVAKTAIQVALANYNPTGTVGAAWKVILENLVGTSSVVEKLSTASSHAVTTASFAGPRANREDKVTVDLPDANGITHTLRLPTPLVDLAVVLGSDKLDITNTLLLSWVSAMTSHAVTEAGVGFTGHVTGGRFIRHKSEKKGGY